MAAIADIAHLTSETYNDIKLLADSFDSKVFNNEMLTRPDAPILYGIRIHKLIKDALNVALDTSKSNLWVKGKTAIEVINTQGAAHALSLHVFDGATADQHFDKDVTLTVKGEKQSSAINIENMDGHVTQTFNAPVTINVKPTKKDPSYALKLSSEGPSTTTINFNKGVTSNAGFVVNTKDNHRWSEQKATLNLNGPVNINMKQHHLEEEEGHHPYTDIEVATSPSDAYTALYSSLRSATINVNTKKDSVVNIRGGVFAENESTINVNLTKAGSRFVGLIRAANDANVNFNIDGKDVSALITAVDHSMPDEHAAAHTEEDEPDRATIHATVANKATLTLAGESHIRHLTVNGGNVVVNHDLKVMDLDGQHGNFTVQSSKSIQIHGKFTGTQWINLSDEVKKDPNKLKAEVIAYEAQDNNTGVFAVPDIADGLQWHHFNVVKENSTNKKKEFKKQWRITSVNKIDDPKRPTPLGNTLGSQAIATYATFSQTLTPVSYTHLTLPTICSV